MIIIIMMNTQKKFLELLFRLRLIYYILCLSLWKFVGHSIYVMCKECPTKKPYVWIFNDYYFCCCFGTHYKAKLKLMRVCSLRRRESEIDYFYYYYYCYYRQPWGWIRYSTYYMNMRTTLVHYKYDTSMSLRNVHNTL